MFPSTRLLEATDLPDLCARDIERLRNSLEDVSTSSDTVTVSIVPSHELISWLHDRADFISSKINGKKSQIKGSCSDETNAWLYWYHDYRCNQLVIQRISLASHDQTSIRALASLLLDARNEAAKWRLPKLVIWSPSMDVQKALEILSGELNDEYAYESQRQSTITMIRWKGSDTSRKLCLKEDEFFARN
jgi:hypothetical protein